MLSAHARRFPIARAIQSATLGRTLTSSPAKDPERTVASEIPVPGKGTPPRFADWEIRQASSIGSHFLIEKYSRTKFFVFGGAATAAALGASVAMSSPVTAALAGPFLAAYWWVGLSDMRQTRHAVLSNFPVLGHLRYLMEGVRPELRQYFFESDFDGRPYSRLERSLAYARSKHIEASQAFGARYNVYEPGYEWVRHSMYPCVIPEEHARITLGGRDCKKPYSASLINISAMSYGALSGNAILALNAGAKRGGFLHNTGEGGISRFHRAPGGDLTWNIGSGYFGCRADDGSFDPRKFADVIATTPQVRMVEIKLSQGAKPGKGGVLPAAKVTEEIAEARGVPKGQDCISPARHSAFDDADGLVRFIDQLRQLSGGLPISVKFCVGRPEEIADMIQAFIEADIFPDVLTVDGGEGGTGAAPSEFSNSVGTPLAEGLYLVDNLLRGSGTRDRVKIIAAGKMLTAMSIIRTLATGADTVNLARAFMFSLGCIQSLSCARDVCPTGIATMGRNMHGLDPADKSYRVYSFHRRTVQATLQMLGAIGIKHPDDLEPRHVMKRLESGAAGDFDISFPRAPDGALLTRSPHVDPMLQKYWDRAEKMRLARKEAAREKKEI